MNNQAGVNLPAGWKVLAIGDLCRLRRELVEPSANGSRQYVGLEHLDPGSSRIKRWDSERGLQSTKHHFHAGDVLYGKLRPYLDKAAIAEWDGVCSTDILTLEANASRADAAFISFLLHTRNFLAHATATTSGVNLPRTSWTDIAAFSHPVPRLEEQRRIAAVLSNIEAGIEVQGQIVATLKALKAATMAKLFREGLRGEPLKQTEIGEIPESWKVVQVGSIFDIQLGKMLSQQARMGINPRPYLRNANVQWGRLDLSTVLEMDFSESEAARFALKPGDILVCEGGEVGRTAIWKGEIVNCCYQKALHRLRPKTGGLILPDYYMYWAMAAFIIFRVHGRQGTTTTIAHLPAVQLEALPMAVPDVDEQGQIIRILSELDRRLESADRKRSRLQRIFSATLRSLMTGQLRVLVTD